LYFVERSVLKIKSSGKTFGPNREVVNLGYYVKRNLYRSPTIVWIVKSRLRPEQGTRTERQEMDMEFLWGKIIVNG
jgi:hypothetical protein